MAIEVPATPKVYTTKYDNFKGVDFTNDSTNVWRRRSPTGTNMLPDASGRPMKRNGWEVLLSQEDIADFFSLSPCHINKCAYFELAGVDHIAIFTEAGVIFYNGNLSTAIYSTDRDCYMGFNKCFFFEGNGTSAFYIYNNYRVWRYEYDDGFQLNEVTDKLTIPTVLYLTSADGTGTLLESYNMIGDLVYVLYCDTDLFTYWGSDGLVFTVDDQYKTDNPKNHSQKYEYTENGWSPALPATITVSSTPSVGDEIFVVNANGILLPNNFDVTSQRIKIWESTTVPFDTEMNAINVGTIGEHDAFFHADIVDRKNRQAWVEFKSDKTFIVPVPNEDYIKVLFSTSDFDIVTISQSALTGHADIDGEVVG